MLKRLGLFLAVVIFLIIYGSISVAQDVFININPTSGPPGTTINVSTNPGADCNVGTGPDIQFSSGQQSGTIDITCTWNGQTATVSFTITSPPPPVEPTQPPVEPTQPPVEPTQPGQPTLPPVEITPTPVPRINCPGGLPEGLPKYVEQGYAYDPNGCSKIVGFAYATDWVSQLIPKADYIRDNCPQYLPGFNYLMTRLRVLSGSDDILEAVNAALTEANACEFARMLIQHDGLPPDFPLGYIHDVLPLACNISLTTNRYYAVFNQLASMDLSKIPLTVDTVCDLIEVLSQLGTLEDTQQGLYAYLYQTCQQDPATASSNVLKAVSYGIEMAELVRRLQREGCANLAVILETLKKGDNDYPDGTPDNFRVCDVTLIRKLITLYWSDLSAEQQRLLINAPSPCEAVDLYLKTGRIQRIEVKTPASGESAAAVVNITDDLPPENRPPGECQRTDSPPDEGASAVFLGQSSINSFADIYVLRIGECEQVTATSRVNEASPSLSLDGEMLAYLVIEGGKVTRLVVRNIASNTKQTETILWQRGDEDLWTIANYPPAWSPDNTQLLVTVEDGNNTAIQVIKNNGISYSGRIIPNSFLISNHVSNPAYAPNGQYFTYEQATNGESRIYVSVLNPERTRDHYTRWLSNPQCHKPNFLSDSIRLFFSCIVDGKEEYYIYPTKVDDDPTNVIFKPEGIAINYSREDSVLVLGITLGYTAEVDQNILYFGPIADSNDRPPLFTNAGVLVSAFRWGLGGSVLSIS